MTLRAGYYQEPSPYHGVIRDDGWPWYSCMHDHMSSADATACARNVRPQLVDRDHQDLLAPLPQGWRVHGQ